MKKLFIIFFLFGTVFRLSATHNRAGEITYKHISGFTYEITVLTYTYSPSPADRPTLDVSWGDGSTSTINRASKTFIGNLTNRNIYKGVHTYVGQGNFIISVMDPNRNGGVINIPGSINVPFYIETELIINPFIGINNSVELLNPPIDNGCVAYPFLHNPSAYDPDGDSISYALAVCKGANGQNVPGFFFPTASSYFSIDPITGTLSWVSPTMQGEYNIAIIIYEYRFGVLIGSVRRDMQITIAACNNNPPVINQLSDTCVEIGTTLSRTISAYDIDNDIVKLTGSGGPLTLSSNAAQFNQPTSGVGFVSSPFKWTPQCDEVRKQPYQMVFKAQDNGSPVNLVDIKTMQITVVASSPKNLTAIPSGNTISLSWSQHMCSNVKRYDVYRHDGYIGYIPPTCVTGVPPTTGYVKVGSTNSISDTTFFDDNNGYGLTHGNDYCYMVVALFPDSAESYPSLEACASLSKDVPVMLNVTVDSTSSSNGQITIRWTKPVDFDTLSLPGPYKYMVYHSEGKNNFNFNLIDSLQGLNDTTYVLKNINTAGIEHNFRVEFLNDSPNNRFFVGGTQITSSVFLKVSPMDNKNILEWEELVPWKNFQYVVYRKNNLNLFDSIATVSTQNFTDTGLLNGVEYCYFVKSIGSYSSTQYPSPLFNLSQRVCSTPIDNEAPCPPELMVFYDCELVENQVIWNDVTRSCGKDVVSYSLYYTPVLNGDFTLIYQTSSPSDTSFLHTNLETIAGCYVITSTDSSGNVSSYSIPYCVDTDSCRPYQLPNVFTPNGDGFNDYFIPFPYDLVNKVEMTILNRWGNLVFETTDPDILWDGKDINSKNECSEGVYFYVCQVYEMRLQGIVKREIRGTVTLIRNK